MKSQRLINDILVLIRNVATVYYAQNHNNQQGIIVVMYACIKITT